MKKILITSIALLTILSLMSAFYSFTQNKGPKAIIGEHKFSLEIARTEKEKQIGLSKYKEISQDFGMLFPFDKTDYYSFWMKDMKFSVDIIFIKNSRIVTIFKNVPAPKSNQEPLPTYKSSDPSDTVLEIKGGLSQKYNFKINDSVQIDL